MDIFDTMTVIDAVPDVWKLVVRLLLAAVAGFLIGLERTARAKDAGVRTQTILCVTSALMMIISKYAFADLMPAGVTYDSSRVASTVITGLSFVGAGMLFYKRESLKSLTTAVGICLNVAIGMAFGAGMFVMGGVATVMTLLIQLFLHAPIKSFKTKKYVEIRVQFVITDGYIEEFKKKYNVEHFVQFRTTRSGDIMIADITFYSYETITSEELFAKMSKDENIRYFEKVQEN